jgi:hypothetical protein
VLPLANGSIPLPRKNTIRKVGKRVVTRDDDAAYLDASQVLARYGGRSAMWLVRLLERDPTFPRPVKIARLRFFKIDDLIAWERKTAAESRARAA